jgi:predicted metal-dependent hydrolase
MGLDWSCGELAEGLACYGRGEFFETHEHWEIAWLTLEEPEKSFVQALIQVAAAFHHWQAGNATGTASLLGRALRRLELCPDGFGGIAVRALCGEISAWLRVIQSGEVSELSVPRICSVDSIADSFGDSTADSDSAS